MTVTVPYHARECMSRVPVLRPHNHLDSSLAIAHEPYCSSPLINGESWGEYGGLSGESVSVA